LQLASPQTERQQSVLDLLHGLKGQEPLKKLFWTELNYDRASSPISRRGWGEQASSALADDPVLFATGGKDFHVIHARLKSENSRLLGFGGGIYQATNGELSPQGVCAALAMACTSAAIPPITSTR
jgi:hypothetical protein